MRRWVGVRAALARPVRDWAETGTRRRRAEGAGEAEGRGGGERGDGREGLGADGHVCGNGEG